MTLQATIARHLLAVARRLAPESRANWATAMSMEFEALPEGYASLDWAAGCVMAALGWRLRAEAPLGIALLMINLAGWLLGVLTFHVLVAWLYPNWVLPMLVADNALKSGAALVLAIAWPRRAVLCALLIPLTWHLCLMPTLFLEDVARALANPALPNLAYPFLFVANEAWPSLLGAAIGWGVGGIWRNYTSGAVAS